MQRKVLRKKELLEFVTEIIRTARDTSEIDVNKVKAAELALKYSQLFGFAELSSDEENWIKIIDNIPIK